ncbi:hypothetical protein PF004_g28539 [Phytophthora fragariae]|uniref:Uncharacterized protein n=1 Tax=Phytophthora fragariae TaxID=53985 RepID=A0A6A3ICZ6_9STRA|nr:hypothetical protein PF011_g22508 [Phytophthora fragariae]KAE9168322.1 hypothetical protein PF004_g28539 [Phytophthora fragariae]
MPTSTASHIEELRNFARVFAQQVNFARQFYCSRGSMANL